MKRILALVLAVVMVATLMCGCSAEYSAKVSKNGKTKISVISAIPVKTIEEMQSTVPYPEEDLTTDDDILLDEDFDFGDEDFNFDLEQDIPETPNATSDNMYGDYDMEDLEDMEIKTVNGVECYVDEVTKSFSSTTKANKYMIKEYGENNDGIFKKFKVTTKQFTATMISDLDATAALLGEHYTLTLKITLPYTITKTNGTLSDNKKTVEFNLLETKKPYAYTTKSDKSAKIYFKKDYLKSNSSVYLDWNTVKSAKKYKVQYKASGDKSWKSVTTKKTSATIKNLKAGKKYSFKVTAVTKSKKYTSITTIENTLKKVTAKVKSKTNKTVKLSWKKNTNADGYIVYQKTSKSGKWKTAKTVKDNNTASYTVKKLKSNKKYYFKVVSYSLENGKKIKSSGEIITAKTKK